MLKGTKKDITAEEMQAINPDCEVFYALSFDENDVVGFYYLNEDGKPFDMVKNKSYLPLKYKI